MPLLSLTGPPFCAERNSYWYKSSVNVTVALPNILLKSAVSVSTQTIDISSSIWPVCNLYPSSST